MTEKLEIPPVYQQYIHEQVMARVSELSATVNAGHIKPPKPATYDGRTDPEIWLFNVDLYFSATGIVMDFHKITYADTLLRGDALVRRKTITLPPTWAEWKALIISAHQAVNPSETARDRLARLRQTTSVRAYAGLFRTVTLAIPTITDEEKKDRFIRGLKPKIMNELKVKSPATFDEAVQMAVRLDALGMWNPGDFPPLGTTGESSQDSSYDAPYDISFDPSADGPTPMDLSVINRPSAATCDPRPAPRTHLTDREREEFRRKGICFKCRRPGHIARECPENTSPRRR